VESHFESGGPLKQRRWLGAALAAASVAAVCAAGVCYWRPVGVFDELQRAWLRLTGVRSRYVQLGSFRIHYFVGGRGKPLVLVHGLDGKAENWTAILPSLMRHGYRVYAIDLLGFGRSDRPDVDYSIALQAELLNRFFESQNLACADLGGWSMGGWVALKFALTHPERVRRLIVADSAGIIFNPPFDTSLFYPATADHAHQLLGLLSSQAVLNSRFVARDVARRMRPNLWIVQRCMQSMTGGGDVLDGQLGALRMPVLIIWGKQDLVIPLSCGEEMHRQMPQSLLAIFDGCGHLAPVECGGRILPEILRFLEAEPPLPAAVRQFPASR
jgi:pimeloyl-ACP methyl ester carboxylesterase